MCPRVGMNFVAHDANMSNINFKKLGIALAIPLAVAFTGSIFTRDAIASGWYDSLNQPSFTPPAWVFGPVWTVLYILMGIALYIVWNQFPGKRRENALGIFALQLLLNFLWSLFFFYFRDIEIALLDSVALWISIVLMMWMFYRVKPLAAWLTIPYLLWVSFATALNTAYWILN